MTARFTGLEVGTPAHAAALTLGRHDGVRTALAWLAFSHLPPELQGFSEPLYVAAMNSIATIADSAELTNALNRLVEAKDWMMRAGIRAQQGRPGPVPRPVEVVDPPAVVDPAGDPYRPMTITDEVLG